MASSKVSDDDKAAILEMEKSWEFTEGSETTAICGSHIMKVLQKEKTVFKNSDGQVITLPATHFKEGWSKMDLPRKKKLLKLWKGLVIYFVVLTCVF